MSLVDVLLPLLGVLLAATIAIVAAARRRVHRRRAAFAQVLDAADALEARLRLARAETGTVAGTDGDPVREALQEMLRQRLWLQQHGASASPATLDTMRASIEAARGRLEQQLQRIADARGHALP
ncbi:hypothetical protein LDO26_09315 [Luteimonas sp. BDR2-5]|uniref:hypothetical protein n=1 Tax=Proluteimonas luteida TaxID=2878685 RepID=UPI001E47D558|nr:hypothetical protein [Luteimonas sp. BDR2-5]MCD9028408.1 hypothetical protein [Luteimonas sp. BDR2-5]